MVEGRKPRHVLSECVRGKSVRSDPVTCVILARADRRSRLPLTSTAIDVHSLPLELLLDIMKSVSEVENDGESSVTVYTALSHVCRGWREMAFSCQEFWAVISCKSSAWTELCLSRWESTPLQLSLQASLTNFDDYCRSLRLVFPHCDRVK